MYSLFYYYMSSHIITNIVNTYIHWNPNRKEVFYVGIGTEKRANEEKRNNFYNSYRQKNCKDHACVVYIQKNQTRISSAFTEKGLISWLGLRLTGQGTLTNMTTGGEHYFTHIITDDYLLNLKKARNDYALNVEYADLDLVYLHSVYLLSLELPKSPIDMSSINKGWSERTLAIVCGIEGRNLHCLLRRFRNEEDFGGCADNVRHLSTTFMEILKEHHKTIKDLTILANKEKAFNQFLEDTKHLDLELIHSVYLISKGLPKFSNNIKKQYWGAKTIGYVLGIETEVKLLKRVIRYVEAGHDFKGNGEKVRHMIKEFIDKLEAYNKSIREKTKQTKKTIELKEKTCPHCGLTGKGGNMARYHFDNCKQNPNRLS